MCYRHATLSFDRPCPECGSMQCNLSMYCSECGADLPYIAHPSQREELGAPTKEPKSEANVTEGKSNDSAES